MNQNESIDTRTHTFQSWTEWTEALRRHRSRSRHPLGISYSALQLHWPRRTRYIVAKAQTDHEGATFISAWHQFTRGLEGQPVETFGEGDDARDLPFGNFQIYVPRPTVTSGNTKTDLLDIATALEEKTFEIRHGAEQQARDRLDVHGLGPAPAADEIEDRDKLARQVASDIQLKNELVKSPEYELQSFQRTLDSVGDILDETIRADMLARVAALDSSIEGRQANCTSGDIETRVASLEASIKAKNKELAQGDLVSRAIAHQRARIAAVEAAAAQAGHREFFWTREPPGGGGGCFKQVIVVLEKPAGVDEDWDRTVFVFVWFDRTAFDSEEEEPEARHEICVEIAVGVTEAAKTMHEIRYGDSNIVASWFEPWLGTLGEPDPGPPSPPSLSRAQRIRLQRLRARVEAPELDPNYSVWDILDEMSGPSVG